MEINLKLLCTVCTALMAINQSSALEFNGRINGGWNALDEDNFAVRIVSIVDDNSPTGFLSTGVAVTPQHVVTVAQAIAGFSIWQIGYGSIRVAEQSITMSRIGVPHPDFNAQFLQNNVGVIRVPIGLPNWHYNEIGFSTTRSPSWALGYGFINDEPLLASILQSAVVYPAPLSTCSEFFTDFLVHNDHVCVTSEYGQIKNGDQGGPAMWNKPYPIIGIISVWGSDTRSPILMVDLREHQDFLEAQFAV